MVMEKGTSDAVGTLSGSRKRGRKELRTIRRAERSHGNEVSRDTTEKELERTAGEPVTKQHINKKNDVPGDDNDEENREKIYGALLTILNSEHPKAKNRTKKATKGPEKEVLKNDGSNERDESSADDMDEVEQLEENLTRSNDHQSDDELSEGEVDEDTDDEQDPFEFHFNQVSEDFITKLDSGFQNKNVKYKSVRVPILENQSMLYSKPVLLKDLDDEIEIPMHKSSIYSYFLKQRLKVQNNLLDSKNDTLTPIQKELVDPMFQYNDFLYEYKSYGKDEDEYRDLYTLHVLNHVFKTRDKILKNNQRLHDNPDIEYLDQGFTRPKVLIVVPTRDTAYQVVTRIIEKSGLDQVDKRNKFRDQFLDESLPPSSKPKSFQHIFKGNTNDFFVLGLKFTRKAIKLYSNFYQSDIIVCSPLGLQLIIENTDKKKRQDDFLSSIEITIIDQLHSIEFQNMAHVISIFDHLNKIPEEQHDTDFGRVRMWYINEQAKLLRQTMIFTKYVSPTANSLINNRCRNWSGRWKNSRLITQELSSIGQLGLKVRQIFQRIDLGGASIMEEPDYRFKYFTSVIIPSIVKSTGYEDGILIYIADYADFIRARNYLREKTTILFGDINEYSDQKQLNSNRSLFQQGRTKVLLYTERLHHFRRYEIKGVKSVIFYQPPTNPEFYSEVVRFIGKSAFLGNTDLNISTVRCIYSKLDGFSLERIVGTKRAAVLTHGQNEIYEFK